MLAIGKGCFVKIKTYLTIISLLIAWGVIFLLILNHLFNGFDNYVLVQESKKWGILSDIFFFVIWHFLRISAEIFLFQNWIMYFGNSLKPYDLTEYMEHICAFYWITIEIFKNLLTDLRIFGSGWIPFFTHKGIIPSPAPCWLGRKKI